MIAKEKHKSLSGSSLGYMLGVMLEKDQQVRIVGYNGFALSRMKIAELERIPTSKEEKKEHKLEVWKIANDLSKIFDARAALADYRVNDPFEDYIISFTDGERDRLRRIPTVEEREVYGLPKLTDGEIDERPLERIILEEFLARIGVHGKIEKTLRRKKDGKKITTKKTVIREAMYMAAAHDGTAHPHLHVFTARPDSDGKVNDTRMERRRIVNATRELSKKYHLSLKLEGYEVDLEKTNEGYAAKIWARDSALWALETATSHEEFARKLNEGMTGVIPSWRVHSETGKEYGILFTKIDKRGKEHTWSGSQLDRRLSYGKVEEALARNLAERKAQEEAIEQALARQAQEEAAPPQAAPTPSVVAKPTPRPLEVELVPEAARTAVNTRPAAEKTALAQMPLPDVILVTRENYDSIRLPEGFEPYQSGGHIVVRQQVVPEEGLVVFKEKGKYRTLPKKIYDKYMENRERRNQERTRGTSKTRRKSKGWNIG